MSICCFLLFLSWEFWFLWVLLRRPLKRGNVAHLSNCTEALHWELFKIVTATMADSHTPQHCGGERPRFALDLRDHSKVGGGETRGISVPGFAVKLKHCYWKQRGHVLKALWGNTGTVKATAAFIHFTLIWLSQNRLSLGWWERGKGDQQFLFSTLFLSFWTVIPSSVWATITLFSILVI